MEGKECVLDCVRLRECRCIRVEEPQLQTIGVLLSVSAWVQEEVYLEDVAEALQVMPKFCTGMATTGSNPRIGSRTVVADGKSTLRSSVRPPGGRLLST